MEIKQAYGVYKYSFDNLENNIANAEIRELESLWTTYNEATVDEQSKNKAETLEYKGWNGKNYPFRRVIPLIQTTIAGITFGLEECHELTDKRIYTAYLIGSYARESLSKLIGKYLGSEKIKGVESYAMSRLTNCPIGIVVENNYEL